MKWCSLNNCNWCVSLDIAYMLALCIEKYDKLLYVAHMNDVSCVCVTETWFTGFMSSESVGYSLKQLSQLGYQ